MTVLTAVSASAFQVYSAIVPNIGDTHMLVHIKDKSCDPKNGNANMITATSNLKGCWIQDGPTIKISVLETNEVKIFPKTEFKFIGDVPEASSAKTEERKASNVTLTCVADAWVGDVTIERNTDGTLQNVYVSGEKVSATEQANAINFTFNGLNISLSTLTGTFNYETSGLQSFINSQMRRSNTKGAGICKINNAQKQF